MLKYFNFQYESVTGSLLALHEVEGLALVMLCNHRVVTRKHALHLLKEVRLIFSTVTLYVTDQVSALCYIPFYSTGSKKVGLYWIWVVCHSVRHNFLSPLYLENQQTSSFRPNRQDSKIVKIASYFLNFLNLVPFLPTDVPNLAGYYLLDAWYLTFCASGGHVFNVAL